MREGLHAHKGNLLVSLTDFGGLVLENMARKRHHRPLFRQHGQKHAILASYRMSPRGGRAPGVDLDYMRQTAELFLATREALEEDREIVLRSDQAIIEHDGHHGGRQYEILSR